MTSFRASIRTSLANPSLQSALDGNAVRRQQGRVAAFASLPDYQERRRRAHAIKADVVANLDGYLEQFIARVTQNGIRVHRAADAKEAVGLVVEIAKDSTRRSRMHTMDSFVPLRDLRGPEILIAKAKSMVSEEINLNHALAGQGMRAVETDLGEYIVQLRGERPSHILTPAVHLRRQDVGELFHEKLGIPYTEDIPTLTATARKVLREVFLNADVGLSGVNFGVVESGTLCTVTNEGNGRMCTTVPPVHIALMGMERLLPTLDDLALFLSLLPRAATGQKLSVYTSLIHSPRRPEDPDGPRERHLVIVDNGRTRLRDSELAEALYCIRCGACLNACPVFREIGGHAYRGTDGSIAPYPGPIGSVISPGLFGLEGFGQLAQASSLCGACKEACPVDIDLPGLLVKIRAGEGPQTAQKRKEGIGLPGALRLGLRGFRFAAGTAGLFALAQRVGGLLSRIASPRSDYMRLPAVTGWGYGRDLPRLEPRPFRARWKGIRQEIEEGDQGIREGAEKPIPLSADVRSLANRFSDELTALGGIVHPVSSAGLPGRLAEFLRGRGIESVFADEVGAQFLPAGPAAGIAVIRVPDPAVRCGVTGALAGLADTGTLVLTGGPGRPLTASLLPEVHVALLRASDLLPSLPEALRRPEVREAAAAVLVSGPSRTADIEMTLTIGVHGPQEIHVFLIDDSGGV
jgi:L-lactate dehydrogenase complex protein LldF